MTLVEQCFLRNGTSRCGASKRYKGLIRSVALIQVLGFIGHVSITKIYAQETGPSKDVTLEKRMDGYQQAGLITLRGRVVDARSGEPVGKVKIIVSGSSQSATTDESGSFKLINLQPGELGLYITTVGYGLIKKTIIVKEDDAGEVVIPLNQENATLTEHVTVTAEPYAVTETNAPAEQTLNKTELQDLSKVIIGDPLRAVHSLPSVTANDDLRSEFSVRGADYHRVGIFLDGILTNSLVHSAAGNADEKVTLSVINSDTIGAVSLLSGAFPAKYGDATAAVLNFVTRDGNRLKPAFRFSTGLQLGTSGVVDGPLANKRGSWLIAARSSFLDYLSRLLLLDTAGASNPAMRTNATRDFAVRFVSLLNDEDHVAALQFGGKVEMIQKWTGDHEAAMLSLKTKLFSGRRTRLTEGLVAAGAALKDMPAGNRHVVLVTDGGESISEVADLQVAVNQLFASQATVHVIGLTLLGRKAINKLHPKYGVTITADKRKSAQDISDEIVRPRDPETLDTKLKRKIYLVIERDLQMWRHSLKYAKTLKRNEQWLTWLAEESGGEILLPGNSDELPQLAGNLARQIDSQYLVTYTPKVEPRLETAQPLRSIEVVSRRVGLFVHSRRSQLGPVSAR